MHLYFTKSVFLFMGMLLEKEITEHCNDFEVNRHEKLF
jgi:hypothetical protein